MSKTKLSTEEILKKITVLESEIKEKNIVVKGLKKELQAQKEEEQKKENQRKGALANDILGDLSDDEFKAILLKGLEVTTANTPIKK